MIVLGDLLLGTTVGARVSPFTVGAFDTGNEVGRVVGTEVGLCVVGMPVGTLVG